MKVKSVSAGVAMLALALGSFASGSAAQGAGSSPPAVAGPTGAGIGDPYYPDDGNPGYDVGKYAVHLDYFRSDQTIKATTTIRSTALDRLRSFDLDLVGLKVLAVEVDGDAADYRRSGAHELVITPQQPVARGDSFVTTVSYRGKPGQDPVGSIPSGWFDATTKGAGFIAGEPHSCTLWYPCNDHPTDKARFSLVATVPRPFAVVSNGSQHKTTSSMRGSTPVRTYRWELSEPTATYLTTIYIDKLTFERSELADGTPVVSAYGPKPGRAPRYEAKLPEILTVLSHYWGPYPAPAAGGIFVSGKVPFSLETFTRPLYTEGAGVGTIVHENAHQWWGDNVSIRRWRDICLNECLASYSQWLWLEHQGRDLDALYRRGVAGRPSWFDAPLYDMGAGHEFDYEGVYLKGQYFLHALRNKIGGKAFFAAMRDIQRDRAVGNLSMIGLRHALQGRTGVDLTSMWRQWVLHTGVPSRRNLYPGDLAPRHDGHRR